MKFTFKPVSAFSRYLYYIGVPLLLVCLIDQWAEIFLLPDLLRVQLLIIAIIQIAIAAIINLLSLIFNMYSDPNGAHNESNPPDGR